MLSYRTLIRLGGGPSIPATVTIRRQSRASVRAEDITVEEANRRSDLANQMMQDFKRQIAAKLAKDRK